MECTIKAPAVVKLYGEHAVVYGKLSVAAAVSMFATASASSSTDRKLHIELEDIGKSYEISSEDLMKLYNSYNKRQEIASYIDAALQTVPNEVLPYATIASMIAGTHGGISGMKLKIHSEIPMQRGFASSAACSTAFALAMLKHSNIMLSDNEAIEIAREGEKVSHISEGAGRIDISTSYYGGYVSYSSGSFKSEGIEGESEIIIIDTGPKKSTAETVGNVRRFYESNRAKAEEYFNEIDSIARSGLEALKNGDIRKAGKLMLENQRLLKELGVSSEGLDAAVDLAVRSGAYGAKLSGGGGGGIAIALAEHPDRLAESMKGRFNVYKAHITTQGAKWYYRH
jgi:mevalonate kinase